MYWEYKTVSLLNMPMTMMNLTNLLSEHGQEQWELIGIYDLVGFGESPFAVFKRPTKYYGNPCDPDALVS